MIDKTKITMINTIFYIPTAKNPVELLLEMLLEKVNI